MKLKLQKVQSLLGPKEVVADGVTYLTDEHDVVAVPPEVAGRPPAGDPAGEDFDPGAGLLAQVDAWGPPRAGRAAATSEENG